MNIRIGQSFQGQLHDTNDILVVAKNVEMRIRNNIESKQTVSPIRFIKGSLVH